MSKDAGNTPIFSYEVQLCESFEDVLDQTGEAISVERLPAVALERGRVLIQAPGGAGKSTTLARAADAARANGLRVLEVWAVRWVSAALAVTPEPDLSTLERTLEASAFVTWQPPGFTADLPSLVLVDGLNELQSTYAQVLLDTLDRIASRRPQVGVLVGDRLIRRRISDSWQLATLTPVPTEQIRKLLGDEASGAVVSLCHSPFFLHLALRDGPLATSQRRFFQNRLDFPNKELRALAEVVSDEYKRRGNRMMDSSTIETSIGQSWMEHLQAAGVLVTTGDESYFTHHLYSDYLAALALAAKPDKWVPDELDALTFRTSSFDALSLLLSEVPPELADELVHSVYDWNMYGAAYLLSEDSRHTPAISSDIRTAIVALLAERRFDRLEATARQAEDALRLQHDELSKRLREANNRTELLAAVSDVELTGAWFNEWQHLFLLDANGREAAFDYLEAADPILGWTAANVAKRSTLTATESARVVRLASDGTRTIRWRAVHTLGMSESPLAIETLLNAVDRDEYGWVAYGSIRSLIEIAATSTPDRRSSIFDSLSKRGESIMNRPELAREVERSLVVRNPPPQWAEDAGLLLEALWAASPTVDEQDRWRRISAKLRRVAA